MFWYWFQIHKHCTRARYIHILFHNRILILRLFSLAKEKDNSVLKLSLIKASVTAWLAILEQLLVQKDKWNSMERNGQNCRTSPLPPTTVSESSPRGKPWARHLDISVATQLRGNSNICYFLQIVLFTLRYPIGTTKWDLLHLFVWKDLVFLLSGFHCPQSAWYLQKDFWFW